MKKLAQVITHRLKDGGGTENQLTSFYYDLMGRPQTTVFPDGTSEISLYDLGQLKTWRTRKNQVKTINYDARGRENSHTWNDGTTPGVSRIWDDAGRLAVVWNIFSSIGYDGAGQVIFEGNDIAGSGGRTQTNYFRYLSGEVAHLYYPGGTYLRRDYTPRGQLEAAGCDDEQNNWWHKLVRYTYRPDGQVDYQDYGNLTTGAFGYDGRGFASSVQHKRTESGDLFAARSYTRDNRDRITAFRKGVNPGSNPTENGRGDKFVYDHEGQLTDAWYNALNPEGNASNWSRKDHFVYDALGNRSGSNNNVASRNAGSTPVSFTRRDNGLNQYSGWTLSAISYDDNFYGPPGNGVMMQEGYITASFNALNQPIAIWSPTYAGTPNFVWFGFDPLGRCVKRWVGESGDIYSNPATYYHFEGWNLLQEGNNAWGPSRIYVHGTRVDEIVASYNTWTGEYAYHHSDARGHCTLLTDRGGNILEQYEYDAFGQPYFFGSFGQLLTTGSLFGNRFLFTGREWLSDLKIYDFRNRHYQPELGRFLQPDPKQFEGGDYNLYRYCHNDPINRSDPFGLDSVIVSFPDYQVSTPLGKFAWGHSGLLTINNETGAARYSEYGRYDSAGIGIVRSYTPETKIQINPDGTVNRDSVAAALGEIAAKSGQNGPAAGAYVPTSKEEQQRIDAYAETRQTENSNANRKPYSLTGNSCNDYPRDAVSAGGINVPSKSSSKPREEIQSLRQRFEPINGKR